MRLRVGRLILALCCLGLAGGRALPEDEDVRGLSCGSGPTRFGAHRDIYLNRKRSYNTFFLIRLPCSGAAAAGNL